MFYVFYIDNLSIMLKCVKDTQALVCFKLCKWEKICIQLLSIGVKEEVGDVDIAKTIFLNSHMVSFFFRFLQ